MNLIHGKLLENGDACVQLNHLGKNIEMTLQKEPLVAWDVINACEELAASLEESIHVPMLEGMGFTAETARCYIAWIRNTFKREYLTQRLHAELGSYYGSPHRFTPPFSKKPVTEWILPLGVILHVADNAVTLPFVSVIEGLLTGNINILELSASDNGLSLFVLNELLKARPELAEYIYVLTDTFDNPPCLQKLAQLADAVVVWGNNEKVKALRELVHPDTPIIEWGVKTSFAYIGETQVDESALEGLALNICETNQLLNHSCQGIYLDTNDIEEVKRFSKAFLPILERVAEDHPYLADEGDQPVLPEGKQVDIQGDISMFYKGKNCGIYACSDAKLHSLKLPRYCWVKPLPKEQLVQQLRPYKNQLHTVSLMCDDKDWDMLAHKLFRSGVIRLTNSRDMSLGYCGDARDGNYSLRRYTKIASIEC